MRFPCSARACCFWAAISSENDQGSMNLASNTSRSLTKPSRVAARKRWTGCWTQRWASEMARPVLRSYQRPVERLGGDAELGDKIVAEVLRLGLAALFLPQPDQRGFVRAHVDLRVRAAEEVAAIIRLSCEWLHFRTFLDEPKWCVLGRDNSSSSLSELGVPLIANILISFQLSVRHEKANCN